MKKLRSYLAAASVRLGLPMDIAAGLTVVGSGLEIRQMHRERLTIIGQIDCLTYGEGGLRGCGG